MGRGWTCDTVKSHTLWWVTSKLGSNYSCRGSPRGDGDLSHILVPQPGGPALERCTARASDFEGQTKVCFQESEGAGK